MAGRFSGKQRGLRTCRQKQSLSDDGYFKATGATNGTRCRLVGKPESQVRIYNI